MLINLVKRYLSSSSKGERTRVLTGLFFIFLIRSSLSLAAVNPSDQFLQGVGQSNKSFTNIGTGHTSEFSALFNAPWLQEFNNKIIKGKAVPADLREKGQAMVDQVEELDRRCAAAAPEERAACTQQRNAAFAQIEKMVADNNPDLKILISQAASQAGDFSSEFDPSNLVSQFDGLFAQAGNLMDMLGSMGDLPSTPTKNALSIPRPAGSSNNITQQLAVGADSLAHLRQTEAEKVPVSQDPTEGFFDKIKNFWQQLKPGVKQALTIHVWAQSPFSTLGQTGQSQLRTITASRETERFNRESKTVNDERDRRVTLHNDIAGQGASALQERVEKNLETMNETTKQQDKALQSLQHICQKQRSNIPCWESGNNIPFDLLALLMGATGGATETPEALELAPYQVWLHCPFPDQPFTRAAEGQTITALFLQEGTPQLLTVKSALPEYFHAEGCIVALPGADDFEYFSATVEPEIIEKENSLLADLALLKINTVHTEFGEDLGDPEAVFDDFITDYWPGWEANCKADPVLRIGDEIQLLGFEKLETEAVAPSQTTTLNGLANFVAEANGATQFTTNGEDSFNGGSLARKENTCFKGLAKIVVKAEDNTNKQSLIPLSVIESWLATQNIILPREDTPAGR